jgi:hypothetical protein
VNITQGQQAYWQQQVNYSLDVRLNDVEHSLDAFANIEYTNNSPDTLSFIWFHVWPNAYKNDKTAFSEQRLINGRTRFYFSTKADKGYLNRLDFKVNGSTARLEDHPQYIDVVKLVLPEPLLPSKTIYIATPFHVQLPKKFSRGGHINQSYQITQWYPKPAVYDRKGWHPMPYLSQGEFYSEFGNYDVRITVPANYVVAATGELQSQEEKNWLKEREHFVLPKPQPVGQTQKRKKPGTKKPPVILIASDLKTKTLQYQQQQVHDFAWFADKYLQVLQDTLQLPSGKIINVGSYFSPPSSSFWRNSIWYLKEAVLASSHWLGEYPYSVVSAVETPDGFGGGMEYPTIASLSPMGSEQALAHTIAHEVRHNWLYGILATNERQHTWMDEGINTYYDSKFISSSDSSRFMKRKNLPAFTRKKLPANGSSLALNILYSAREDQPIETPSDAFTSTNYYWIGYEKAAEWMTKLETTIGKEQMDACMKGYYINWQFKHPYPEDFKQVVEAVSNRNLDSLFNDLSRKGPLLYRPSKKITPTFLFNLNDTDRKYYVSFSPMAGFNWYDGFMIGAVAHNYQLPFNRWEWVLSPLYATKSKQLNGLARISHTWFPASTSLFHKMEAGVAAARFTADVLKPVNTPPLYFSFAKAVPFLRFTFKRSNPLSSLEKYIQWKTYFISEESLNFRRTITGMDTVETFGKKTGNRYVNQLQLVAENSRVLYPYRAELQIEQGRSFVRTAFTGNYFLNYKNGDGARIRFFAAKFSYLGRKTTPRKLETAIYHPKLTAVRGDNDYTYSNYFLGRNGVGGSDVGLPDQQIMLRDGGLKIRTDIFSGLQGRSDNWIAALNLSTPLPIQVLPFGLTRNIRLFFDAGTFAEAWVVNYEENRFLYTGGFQLSLFKNLVNIYYPVVFNKEIRTNLKTVPQEYKKRISFSIDIQNLQVKKQIQQLFL